MKLARFCFVLKTIDFILYILVIIIAVIPLITLCIKDTPGIDVEEYIKNIPMWKFLKGLGLF
jgi:hypothetical protein